MESGLHMMPPLSQAQPAAPLPQAQPSPPPQQQPPPQPPPPPQQQQQPPPQVQPRKEPCRNYPTFLAGTRA